MELPDIDAILAQDEESTETADMLEWRQRLEAELERYWERESTRNRPRSEEHGHGDR